MELNVIALEGAMLCSSGGKQRDERLQDKSESQFLLAVLTLHRASVLRHFRFFRKPVMHAGYTTSMMG